MAEMNDFDLEVQDEFHRTTEHINGLTGVIAGIGGAITITPANNRVLQGTLINNPLEGVRANNRTSILYASWDNVNFITIPAGDNIVWGGKGYGANENTVKLYSNNSSVNYEIMVVS